MQAGENRLGGSQARYPQTLLSKIWNNHIVVQERGAPAVLYIDLHLVHEVTSPQAFNGLRNRQRKVRRPDKTVATIDHSVPTQTGLNGRMALADLEAQKQVRQLEINCQEFGIPLFGLDSPNQGIIHIIAPELGLTQPGMTIVCGDSHTATHGAFGALAFGIGSSEVEHVLASQCLLQAQPKSFEVRIEGKLLPGVSAKDIILALIRKVGVGGGAGHVFEYHGAAIRSLTMDERMTICNMSIEGGARAGMIAPDEVTYEYLAGRTFAPEGKQWERAIAHWRGLPSDEGAVFDRSVYLDASTLEPMITFGTNPGMGLPVSGRIPDTNEVKDAEQKMILEKALAYMDLKPGQPLAGHKVDVVFIGSCTNGRLSDLQQAARILKDRRIADGIRLLVVPGSAQVKRLAESEHLDRVFIEAGGEWREPGCSMCIGMNGDQLQPGQYSISTSNRNFEGRQGRGGRTFLASPLTAAAAAITGEITDPRIFL
jgi:3-isopropylmalate/(R)-2-methylmalate dehydratase large subunit